NDIADDRVLEQRPVRPRWVVRVASPGRAVGSGFQRDHDGSAPAFDRAEREAEGGNRLRHTGGAVAVRNSCKDVVDQAQRLECLIEAHRNAGGDVAIRVRYSAYGQRLVRRRREIATQIALESAGTGRES